MHATRYRILCFRHEAHIMFIIYIKERKTVVTHTQHRNKILYTNTFTQEKKHDINI